MEWTVNPTGHGGSTFGQSCIKIASNRTLHLQDVNTRGFSGAYDGKVSAMQMFVEGDSELHSTYLESGVFTLVLPAASVATAGHEYIFKTVIGSFRSDGF